MRSFIITVIIGICMVASSIFYTNHLKSESERLSDITDQIKICLKNDDYKGAKEQLDHLKQHVDKFEKFFLATGDHIEIDNIKINIAELDSFIKYEKKSDSISKVYVLKFLFSHLPHNSKVNIGNIL